MQLIPEITVELFHELTAFIASAHISPLEAQLQHRNAILQLTKFVIRENLSMSNEMLNRFPRIYGINPIFWDDWAVRCCRFQTSNDCNRLIWVDGIWCGTSLEAKVVQLEDDKTSWLLVVSDDDDWVEHSKRFDIREDCLNLLNQIQWLNTLSEVYQGMQDNPLVSVLATDRINLSGES